MMSGDRNPPTWVSEEPASGPEAGDGGESTGSTSGRWLALLIVLAAAFMELVDISIVNVAIPSIQSELGASYSTLEFIIAGYQLGFACVIITAARLGDIYGRRRLFMIGMVTFTVASLACGAAPTIGLLITARVVQGVGSGLMFPQVLSIIQVTFPPRERGKALAVFGAVVGIAAIIGPLAGGLLIEWNVFGWGWRTIFFVNIPVGVAAAVAALAYVPESRASQRSQLDLVGTAIVSVALFMLVYPLVEGRSVGWPWWTVAMLVLAVVLLGAFTAYEIHRTRQRRSPLVEMTLFRQRAFAAGSAIALVFFAGLGAFFFVAILYLQVGFGYSALHAGLTILPFAVGAGGASAASNVLTGRWGTRVLNAGAALLVAGMVGLLVTVRANVTSIESLQLSPALLVAGAGLGLVVAPLTDVVLSRVEGRETGSASGVLTAAQRVGGSIGIAVVGVIFFWQLSAAAGSSLAAVTPRLRNNLLSAGLPDPVVEQVVAGFETCFRVRDVASDPNSTPPTCAQLDQQAAAAPIPEPVAASVRVAITDEAAPEALRRSFASALEAAIVYEIAVFSLVFALVFVLPRSSSGELSDSLDATGGHADRKPRFTADGSCEREPSGTRRSATPAGPRARSATGPSIKGTMVRPTSIS